MKKYLIKVFAISWIQILLIVVFSGIKYVMTENQLADDMSFVLTWIGVAAGAVLVCAVSVRGFIENKGAPYQEWLSVPKITMQDKVLAFIAEWGIRIPAITGFFIISYVFAANSWWMLAAMYAGLVVKNIMEYPCGEEKPADESG